MALLDRELNFPRKAHRVDIPLLVQIDGQVYQAADWSMTGVGIKGYPEQPEIGTRIKARLILPLADVALQMEVTLIVRNRRETITGCEFENLSNRNRRVLRHFVELALEGRTDIIEDLVADLSAPDIESPLETALALSEEEEISLLAKFRSRASFALILGVLFASFLVFTLWYNHVFLYKTVGVVQKDMIEVSSGESGLIGAILHRAGDRIGPGDILFEMSSSSLDEQIAAVRQNLAAVQQELATLPGPAESSRLTTALADELKRQENLYRNARELYNQGIISIKDFEFVQGNWSRARINYFRQVEIEQERAREQKIRQEALRAEIHARQQELALLRARQERQRIRSPGEGTVYSVGRQPGEFVSAGEVVMVVARDTSPSVLFKMPSSQVARIGIGTPVHVYSYATDQTYRGRVASIGYKAVNPGAPESQEVSLDMTVIRVSLPPSTPSLVLNSRVKVWVRKQVHLGRTLARFLPAMTRSGKDGN